MTRKQQILVIAFALLLAEAGTVSADVIVSAPSGLDFETIVQGSPFTFSFPEIDNATELLSVTSGATVGGNESGNFILDIKYTNGDTQQIFTTPIDISSFFDLSTVLTDLTFTEGPIDGLVFMSTSGNEGLTYFLDIAEGTQFDFAQAETSEVPEPASAALLGGALGLLGTWLRRRKPKTPAA